MALFRRICPRGVMDSVFLPSSCHVLLLKMLHAALVSGEQLVCPTAGTVQQKIALQTEQCFLLSLLFETLVVRVRAISDATQDSNAARFVRCVQGDSFVAMPS
jgi:hypothetical protein